MKNPGSLALLIVCLASFLLLCLNFSSEPQLGDEGVLAMDGWRICRGEVPHRDFFQLIPPMAAYLQSFCLNISGVSVFSVRILGLIYGIALLALAFLFYGKMLRDRLVLAASLSIIVPAGFDAWMFGSHHWLCDILQLAGSVLLLAAIRNSSKPLSFVAGIFFGSAAFALQDQGGYAIAGLLVAGIIFSGGKSLPFRYAAAGALSGFVLLVFPLVLSVGGVSPLWHDWVLFPLLNYKDAANPGGIREALGFFTVEWDLRSIKEAPLYTIGLALKTDILILSPLFCAASLIYLWIKKAVDRNVLALITIISLSFLFGSMHRFAPRNAQWGFVLTLPVFIVLEILSNSARRRATRCLALTAVILVLAVFLLLSVGETCLSLSGRIGKYRVSGNTGSYSSTDAALSSNLNGLIAAIEDKVPKDESFFCAGYVPLVNYIVKRPNPTRYNFMVFGGYYSKNQMMIWKESILKENIRWGVSLRENMNEHNGGSILPGFRPAFVNEMFVLWERKKAVPPVKSSLAEDVRSGAPTNE